MPQSSNVIQPQQQIQNDQHRYPQIAVFGRADRGTVQLRPRATFKQRLNVRHKELCEKRRKNHAAN